MEVSGVSPDWLVQLAYDSVKTTMPAVQTYLAERHGDAFPKAKAIFSPASHLLERLLAGLPPNEFRSAENKPVVASLECMVNAAWLFRLGALQNLSENRQADERHIPNLATVNRLTLRAIELARVHAEYQVWEERQRGATDA
jgi:hypothetical protein